MKMLTTATLLKPSTLLMVVMSLNVGSSSAIAKNHHSATKSQDLGYAYSPLSAGDRNNTARSEAIRTCNAEAARWRYSDWQTAQETVYRDCMTQHGQSSE
jgi:hypothetical protein